MLCQELGSHKTTSSTALVEVRRAMEFDVEIYELESGRIHVTPRGGCQGALEFDSSDVFAGFVARCREFLDNERHAKKTMEWLVEQNDRAEENCSRTPPGTPG